MSARLPYDAEHLTDVEKDVQRLQEHKNCWTCNRLMRDKRSGSRYCEDDIDVVSVLYDGVQCVEWEQLNETE